MGGSLEQWGHLCPCKPLPTHRALSSSLICPAHSLLSICTWCLSEHCWGAVRTELHPQYSALTSRTLSCLWIGLRYREVRWPFPYSHSTTDTRLKPCGWVLVTVGTRVSVTLIDSESWLSSELLRTKNLACLAQDAGCGGTSRRRRLLCV